MVVANDVERLAELLQLLREYDTDYEIRYGLVLRALVMAHRLGYAAGIRVDPSPPGWPVVVIELPTGQVAWHIPPHGIPWDGHTTPEKYERIARFAEQVASGGRQASMMEGQQP